MATKHADGRVNLTILTDEEQKRYEAAVRVLIRHDKPGMELKQLAKRKREASLAFNGPPGGPRVSSEWVSILPVSIQKKLRKLPNSKKLDLTDLTVDERRLYDAEYDKVAIAIRRAAGPRHKKQRQSAKATPSSSAKGVESAVTADHSSVSGAASSAETLGSSRLPQGAPGTPLSDDPSLASVSPAAAQHEPSALSSHSPYPASTSAPQTQISLSAISTSAIEGDAHQLPVSNPPSPLHLQSAMDAPLYSPSNYHSHYGFL